MAKAKKLPSGSWRVLVYSHTETVDEKKVRRYTSFTHEDKAEAEYLASQYRRSKDRGPKKQSKTVGQGMDDYIKSKDAVLSPATVREYKRSRKRDLAPLMGINIDDLTQEQIQKAINEEARTHSPKTVKNMLGLLTAMLGMYRPDFKVRITLPMPKKFDIYVPSDDDITKLIKAISGTELEKAVLLAAFGSLRRSEISPLVDTDIKGSLLTINKAMVYNDNKKLVPKTPKTFTSYRVIELPQSVIDKFAGVKGPLVNLTPDQITKRFIRALTKNGLEKFRFHDLRHYQASILHALNVPDKYIMERGGWRSKATLDKVYKHTMDAKHKEVTKVANSHFEKLLK